MFGFRFSVRSAAALLIAAVVASAATSLEAQSAHRTRRESNANRKARIERTIQDTYSHKWEVGGGGGYLRFRSGEYLQTEQRSHLLAYRNPLPQPEAGHHRWRRRSLRQRQGRQHDLQHPESADLPVHLHGRPQLPRLRLKEKYAVSIFGTVGAGIGKFDSGSKGIPAQNLGMWPSETRAVFSAGANRGLQLLPEPGHACNPPLPRFNLGRDDPEQPGRERRAGLSLRTHQVALHQDS